METTSNSFTAAAVAVPRFDKLFVTVNKHHCTSVADNESLEYFNAVWEKAEEILAVVGEVKETVEVKKSVVLIEGRSWKCL